MVVIVVVVAAAIHAWIFVFIRVSKLSTETVIFQVTPSRLRIGQHHAPMIRWLKLLLLLLLLHQFSLLLFLQGCQFDQFQLWNLHGDE